MDAKDRRHVLRRWEALTRLHIAVGDVTANLGGDLIVERQRVVSAQLDFLHGDRHSITIMWDGPTALKDRPAALNLSPEAVIREARQRRRRRWATVTCIIVLVVGSATLVLHLTARSASHRSPISNGAAPHRSIPPSRAASSSTPKLDNPSSIALAANGTLLISNQGTNQVLAYVPSDHRLRVVAGTGKAGFGGDGGPPVNAQLTDPSGLAVGPDGIVYVADSGNGRIRAIEPNGTISTIAGDGGTGTSSSGPALETAIATPRSLAVGPDGTIYFSDGSGVWKLAAGVVTTAISYATTIPILDNDPAAQLEVTALAVNGSADIYVANPDSIPETIDEFSATGAFIMAWENRTNCLSIEPSGVVLVCSPNGPVARITGAGLTVGMSTDSERDDTGLTDITSFGNARLPAIEAASAVANASGEVYAVSGPNGFSGLSGLVAIDPDGRIHELLTSQLPRPPG
jgi:hypothetical protein